MDIYNKVRVISGVGLPPKSKKLMTKLTHEDLLEFCRYGHPSVFSFYRYSDESPPQTNTNTSQLKTEKQFITKLKQVRDEKTGNSCLHIAAMYDNYKLAKFLVNNETQICIDPNTPNNRKQNALMVNLKYNNEEKADRISSLLIKYTNPLAVNELGQRVYQGEQAIMSPSRARILQILKKLALSQSNN